MPGQKFETKQRITVRNLRIREDTAKVGIEGRDEDLTKHQTDTACAWLVCHNQEGLCKLYPPYPTSPEAQTPIFWGNQSCNPAAWLAERHLLAGDIESNPGH